MSVMNIRIVRMAVSQRHVRMRMRVWLLAIPIEIMRVLVMFVVHMPMCVRHGLMGMHVLVALGQV